MWLAGPPCGRVPGRLREGSRLYSYLRRGDITALKPHNLLPHPAASTFWRRPSRSPPTLATGHQSHRAQGGVGEGKRRQQLSKKDLCPPDRLIVKLLVSELTAQGTVAYRLQAVLTGVLRMAPFYMAATTLSLPPSPSARAVVVSTADIAATSGKTVDCIVTAERGRAQNHTTYYLTPKAVSQSWRRAGCRGFSRSLLEKGELGTW